MSRRGALPEPDFIPQASRPPALAWAWALAALLLMALLAHEAWLLRQATEAADLRVASTQSRLAALKRGEAAGASMTRMVPGATRGGRADANEGALILAAHTVAGRLQHPWGWLLAGLEHSTPAGLQLIALEHEAERPDLRIEGQAATTASVLQLVDALATRPGWSEVVLKRLQNGEGAQSGEGVRFEIGAQLKPALMAAPAGDAAARETGTPR